MSNCTRGNLHERPHCTLLPGVFVSYWVSSSLSAPTESLVPPFLRWIASRRPRLCSLLSPNGGMTFPSHSELHSHCRRTGGDWKLISSRNMSRLSLPCLPLTPPHHTSVSSSYSCLLAKSLTLNTHCLFPLRSYLPATTQEQVFSTSSHRLEVVRENVSQCKPLWCWSRSSCLGPFNAFLLNYRYEGQAVWIIHSLVSFYFTELHPLQHKLTDLHTSCIQCRESRNVTVFLLVLSSKRKEQMMQPSTGTEQTFRLRRKQPSAQEAETQCDRANTGVRAVCGSLRTRGH